MWGNSAILLARVLAMLALVTQALMPGAMAAAMSRPGDVPAIVCAMPGKDLSAGASTLGADLANLLADKAAGDLPDESHDCHDCVLAQGAALPSVAAVAAPAFSAPVPETAPRTEVRFWAMPRGPPLGSRAPPVSLKA
jgi:hypothetical protein